MLVPSFPILTRDGRQVLHLPGHVVDGADEVVVLERDHGAVQADEEVDVALPGLGLRSHAVDEERRSGDRYEDRIDVPPEAPEQVPADALLLGDRAELAEIGRDVARILGRTGERAVRPSQAAQRERGTDPSRRDQRCTPVDWLVPARLVVVQLTAHAILLCRWGACDADSDRRTPVT